MATNKPQTDFVKTALRLPPELHANVHIAAAGSGRSYNAEIVARLEESFRSERQTGRALPDDQIEGMVERVIGATIETTIQRLEQLGWRPAADIEDAPASDQAEDRKPEVKRRTRPRAK